MLLEDPVESGDTWKAGLKSHFRDGQRGVVQHFLRNLDTPVSDVITERITGILLEQSDKMILAETGHGRNGIQIQIIRIMRIDIIKQRIEFLNILFLLVGADIWKGCFHI